MRMEPFYLDVGGTSRFCVHWPPSPSANPKGAVLYVHPFAEEMNKSRRMAALQARRFAASGWAVLQIDLFGFGDSSGDLGDARIEDWETDLDAAAAWLCARHSANLVVWGLRLGATIAVSWMDRSTYRGRFERALLWQPITSGARHLDQFLRIAVASNRTTGDGSDTLTVSGLRQRLGAGETLEIGGYRLNARFAAGLDTLKLDGVRAPGLSVSWLEVGSQVDSIPSEEVRRIVKEWRCSGCFVDMRSVPGEPFWATAEIVECDALLRASTQAVVEC